LDPSTDIILKLVVILIVSILSLRMRFIDFYGFIASLAIGVSVLFLGGWKLFILLLLFLTVGSLLTKVLNGGGGIRGWKNVVANGLWAALSASLYGVTGDKSALIFYLGALNSMFSDTLSTEVGMYIGGRPRLIVKPWVETSKGLSGGVTVHGILGGITGALIFAYLSSYLFNGSLDSRLTASIAGAGILANVLDSFLGASIQGKYECSVCGRVVEDSLHCGEVARHLSGLKYIDNHKVNFISSFVGGGLAVLLYTHIF